MRSVEVSYDLETGMKLPTESVLNEGEFPGIENFKRQCRTDVVRIEGNEMEFDIVGINPALANTLRRIMISEVPTMAIEKVHVMNNTSIIQDEVLAHMLGLIPLKADPRRFEMKSDPKADPTERDTLEYSLKIKCSVNKDNHKQSSRAVEDMYKNSNVYSRDIKWVPIGNQKKHFSEEDVAPVDNNILIAKMRPGHELDFKLIAVKGIGSDHAKFSPVCTASYRLLPSIKLLRSVEDEDAVRLQKCFSPGVIGIRHDNGRRYAVVNSARYDANSRNVLRHDDLKDAVHVGRVRNHYIYSVESTGALKPDEIFVEAIKVFRNKLVSALDEVMNTF